MDIRAHIRTSKHHKELSHIPLFICVIPLPRLGPGPVNTQWVTALTHLRPPLYTQLTVLGVPLGESPEACSGSQEPHWAGSTPSSGIRVPDQGWKKNGPQPFGPSTRLPGGMLADWVGGGPRW